MNIEYYQTSSGRKPVEKYIEGLEKQDQALCAGDLDGLKKCKTVQEIRDSVVEIKPIEGKLWEIKTGAERKQRIFYVLITGFTMVLLHACRKTKQKAEKKELNLAKKRMKEVLDE